MTIIQDKNTLVSALSSGGPKGHFGNQAASLKIEKLYASPVLYNGLASLVLSKKVLSTAGVICPGLASSNPVKICTELSTHVKTLH